MSRSKHPGTMAMPSGTEPSPYAGAEAKPHKYRAVRTQVDGISFHSKKEARRYSDLKTLENGGAISSLSLQPKFVLTVNNVFIGKYIADFQYKENGEWKIEDSKGVKTRDYVMKRRLMLAIFGIEVLET